MPILDPFLRAVLTPAGICLIILLMCSPPWRPSQSFGRAWGGALAHGLGYTAAFVVMFGWPGWPADEDWKWLAYVGPIGMITGWVDGVTGAGSAIRWRVRLIGAVAAAWILVPGWMESRPAWIIGLSLAGFVCSTAIGDIARRASALAAAMIVIITLAGVTFVLVQSGNARFAQLSTALLATFCARIIVILVSGDQFTDRGGYGLAGLLIAGLSFDGLFNNYGDAPALVFVILAVTPLAALVPDVGPLRGIEGWKSQALRVAIVILVVAACAWSSVPAGET